MKTIIGDLIKLAKEGQFDVIVHGCNCFHTMGAGIAKQIKEQFPEAYENDCKYTKMGDPKKLGGFTSARVGGVDGHRFTIINGYTQFDFHGKNNVDYEAIREVFSRVKDKFSELDYRIGYPMIGAGLAGGDWNIISKIIDEELEGEDHTFVIYDQFKE